MQAPLMMHDNADADSVPHTHDAGMADWNPDQARAAVERFIKEQGTNVNALSKGAGLSSNTLRNFLAGKSGTLTHATLEKIARYKKVSIEQIVGSGNVPPSEAATPPFDRELMISAICLVEEYLAARDQDLDPQSKALTVVAIYALARRAGQREVEPADYENVIQLALLRR